jgi:hypothetical protein
MSHPRNEGWQAAHMYRFLNRAIHWRHAGVILSVPVGALAFWLGAGAPGSVLSGMLAGLTLEGVRAAAKHDGWKTATLHMILWYSVLGGALFLSLAI